VSSVALAVQHRADPSLLYHPAPHCKVTLSGPGICWEAMLSAHQLGCAESRGQHRFFRKLLQAVTVILARWDVACLFHLGGFFRLLSKNL
jgi:hypothetical protein